MHHGAIRFNVLSPDDGDGLIHFELSASNYRFSAAEDFYEHADFALLFAQALMEFPEKAGDTVQLEIGSMENRSAYYLSLRAYIFDAVGHSALEVIVDNQRTGQDLARAAFQIHCDIAAINRLGNDLLKWSPDTGASFSWKSIDREA
jgi:hypothetical protein